MSTKLIVEGDGAHLAPSTAATAAVNRLPATATLEQELDAMVSDLRGLELDIPDEAIRVCTGYMARCTELHVQIVRVEGRDRSLRWFRTQQLAKVIELIEFVYRSSSRIVEIRRQDAELSR